MAVEFRLRLGLGLDRYEFRGMYLYFASRKFDRALGLVEAVESEDQGDVP